jgi:hypothetical protein
MKSSSSNWVAYADATHDSADTKRCRTLWAAVLVLAILDFYRMGRNLGQPRKAREDEAQESAREFFASDYFDEVCEYVGLNSDIARTIVTRLEISANGRNYKQRLLGN